MLLNKLSINKSARSTQNKLIYSVNKSNLINKKAPRELSLKPLSQNGFQTVQGGHSPPWILLAVKSKALLVSQCQSTHQILGRYLKVWLS